MPEGMNFSHRVHATRSESGLRTQYRVTLGLMTRLAMFGRVDELAAIEAFPEPVPSEPSALQIAGAAGIGKNTLLRHAMMMASRRVHGSPRGRIPGRFVRVARRAC